MDTRPLAIREHDVDPCYVGDATTSVQNINVYCAEASTFLQLLARKNDRAHLVFMDPPFNNGTPYQEWNDKLDRDEFFECLHHWMVCAEEVLEPNGSLWVHVPDEWAADVVVIGRDTLGLDLENWIIWHYRFGQHQRDRFIRSKCHGLWFSKGNPRVNPESALVPSDRAAIYDDPRVLDSDRLGQRMDLDVWGFDQYWGRVQGNNKERRPLHPNQLPEVYLDRIIRLLTNEGDHVVDPFCGSGTTAVVASALKRRVSTGDICKKYAESALERIRGGTVRVDSI